MADNRGLIHWELNRSADGHRTYKATWQVRPAPGDGPLDILFASGLPAVGTGWAYGNTLDPWAFCTPETEVTYTGDREPGRWWHVTQTFTTTPTRRCQDVQVENPLSEPVKVSGSFVTERRATAFDRFGKVIKNSAHRPYKGSACERDFNRPNVTVAFNTVSNPLALYAPMIDTVNGVPMWGLPVRTVKLSNVTWERKTYGVCTYYYTISYEFHIRYETWDEDLLDESDRYLKPGGNPDKQEDFIIAKDDADENITVILDGSGSLWDTSGEDPPGKIHVEFYNESNFFVLGVPVAL